MDYKFGILAIIALLSLWLAYKEYLLKKEDKKNRKNHNGVATIVADRELLLSLPKKVQEVLLTVYTSTAGTVSVQRVNTKGKTLDEIIRLQKKRTLDNLIKEQSIASYIDENKNRKIERLLKDKKHK